MTRDQSVFVLLLVAAITAPPGGAGAQAGSDTAGYDARCGECHGRDVRALARDTLRLTGDQVVTRRRGAELRDFLARHGRATPAEADQIYRLLRGFVAGQAD